MADVTPSEVTVFPNGGVLVLARVLDWDDSAFKQADFGTITCKAFDVKNPGSATSSETPTVANVIYDTLQTDSRWTKDSTGYNFAYIFPASAVPNSERDYQLEVKFEPTGKKPTWLRQPVTTTRLYSS